MWKVRSFWSGHAGNERPMGRRDAPHAIDQIAHNPNPCDPSLIPLSRAEPTTIAILHIVMRVIPDRGSLYPSLFESFHN
jgi:hypothetical protein